MASAVETSWTTTALPIGERRSIAGSRLGSFIDKSSCAKKRCLVPSKIDSAADLAPELSVSPLSLIDDPGGFERVAQVGVDDRPGLGIGIVDRDLVLGQAMLEDLVFDAGE
jgi:hypothetical protein